MIKDKQKAITQLSSIALKYLDNAKCLGVGAESVIFADADTTYKIFAEQPTYYFNIGKQLKGRFNGCKRLFDTDVTSFEGHTVITYPYSSSTAYNGGHRDQIIEFLAEIASRGVICRDVKPKNFRVFENGLRFIDYGRDFLPFSEREFLYMCQRAYLCLTHWADPEFIAVARKAQNTWLIPDLEGFNEFFNEAYMLYLEYSQQTSYKQFILPENRWIEQMVPKENTWAQFATEDFSEDLIYWPVSQINTISGDNLVVLSKDLSGNLLEHLNQVMKNGSQLRLILPDPLFNSKEPFNNTVSKLEIYGFKVEATEHSEPRPVSDGMASRFCCFDCVRFESSGRDVTLLIKTCYQDSGIIDRTIRHIVSQLERPDHFLEKLVVVDSKKKDFLRAYDEPNESKLISALEKLVSEGIINNYLISPSDSEEVRRINKRWFNVDCSNTHCIRNIPVVPSLWAFEQCKGQYILQMDTDPIVVRRDYNHSYLSDMKSALIPEDVMSVSFNIAHSPDSGFKEYIGNFCPEVRMGLIHRERFLKNRPYPNEVKDGKLVLTWYRSMEKWQKEKGFRSLRGGDPRTFYIHPMNNRKTDKFEWFSIIDRAESNAIPIAQYEHNDLCGSIEDWYVPQRSFEYMFIICGRNISNERFLRCWDSVTSQVAASWGAIIVNDCSENSLDECIREYIRPWKDRTVYINNPERKYILFNIVRSIKKFCKNPDSAIITLDMDDALLSKDFVSCVSKQYLRGHDLVSTQCLKKGKGILPCKIDYNYPRNERMGDVWEHARTFKKYMFDQINENNFLRNGKYIDVFNELTFMVPLAEMATSPIQFPAPLYIWEPSHVRDAKHYSENEEMKEYLRKCPRYEKYLRSFGPGDVRVPGDIISDVNDNSIIVIRHGEKEKLKGVASDAAGLTPRGREEARIFGSALPKISLFLTSPVYRTSETAWCIREGNESDAQIVVDNFMSGIPRNGDLLKSNPDLNLIDLYNLWGGGFRISSVPESAEEYKHRVISHLLEIKKKTNGPICIVTHDHMINALSSLFKQLTTFKVPYLGGFVWNDEELKKALIQNNTVESCFIPDKYCIEIDITYRCNLHCFNCDRSCTQAIDESDMELTQIRRFLELSEQNGHNWKRIRVLGGEPLMHPEIAAILNELNSYKIRHPSCLIQIYTNGLIPVKISIPSGIILENTAKTSPVNRFDPYNVAPCDLNPKFVPKGCWITRDCGIGFNCNGFYICGAGAAIDRVFGFGVAADSPDTIDTQKQYSALCKYCGHCLHPEYRNSKNRIPLSSPSLSSHSWSEAYTKYKEHKPKLKRWGN